MPPTSSQFTSADALRIYARYFLWNLFYIGLVLLLIVLPLMVILVIYEPEAFLSGVPTDDQLRIFWLFSPSEVLLLYHQIQIRPFSWAVLLSIGGSLLMPFLLVYACWRAFQKTLQKPYKTFRFRIAGSPRAPLRFFALYFFISLLFQVPLEMLAGKYFFTGIIIDFWLLYILINRSYRTLRVEKDSYPP